MSNLLNDVIDIHIHTSPDVNPRRLNDYEAANAASKAGMKAIVIKSHHAMTADRAALVNELVEGIQIFGGLALNYAAGGLNPQAVETALRLGAKLIWMPTLDAKHFRSQIGQSDGISILMESCEVHSEIGQIVDLINN